MSGKDDGIKDYEELIADIKASTNSVLPSDVGLRTGSRGDFRLTNWREVNLQSLQAASSGMSYTIEVGGRDATIDIEFCDQGDAPLVDASVGAATGMLWNDVMRQRLRDVNDKDMEHLSRIFTFLERIGATFVSGDTPFHPFVNNGDQIVANLTLARITKAHVTSLFMLSSRLIEARVYPGRLRIYVACSNQSLPVRNRLKARSKRSFFTRILPYANTE